MAAKGLVYYDGTYAVYRDIYQVDAEGRGWADYHGPLAWMFWQRRYLPELRRKSSLHAGVCGIVDHSTSGQWAAG